MSYIRVSAIALSLVLSLARVAAAQSSDTVIYYHTDAIGSVRMTTDANGGVLERYDFQPFGVACGTACGTGTTPEAIQFAGKERDAGFDYFGARSFEGVTGRFTTVDPALNDEALFDPQLWNRYAYARNNPLAFVDPDGRDPRSAIRAAVLAADVAAPFTGGASLVVAAIATAGLVSYEAYEHRREIAESIVQLGMATRALAERARDSLVIQSSRLDPYKLPDGFPGTKQGWQSS